MLLLLLVLLAAPFAAAVRPHDFKTCAQSSFCRRLRSLPERVNAAGKPSPYALTHAHHDPADVSGPASWTFPLKTELHPEVGFALTLDILAAGEGIARVRVDEVGSTTQWKRYNETARWALVDEALTLANKADIKFASHASNTVISYGPKGTLQVELQHSPLRITFKQHNKPVMVMNERSLFHMEHFRAKPAVVAAVSEGTEGAQVPLNKRHDTTWFEGEPDHELFEESFGKWRDSKPKGRW